MSKSDSDDGAGSKTKGPGMKDKHRGDPFDNSAARLNLFCRGEHFVEFRTIFDKLPNHATLLQEMEKISEDWKDSEFFTCGIAEEDDPQSTSETAGQTINSLGDTEKD